METAAYRFRTLGPRALWFPLCCLGLVFGIGIFLGQVAIGWLLAMSVAVIVITGQAFSDAKAEPRFWATLAGYGLVHIGILSFSNEAWIPKPTAAITPVFLLDYLAMAWAFPKLSGLRFDVS
jgi:uncharacterized membrane protein AbrB (regulator of aidB expression)